MPKNLVRMGLIALGVVVIGFLVIQLVPVWLYENNPPVVAEPQWPDAQTRALAQRACFDCHSNETVWPWYSKVAPVSWLVVFNTWRGRRHLNFSEWTTGRQSGESAEKVLNGEMPPRDYKLMHPEAKLTPAERQQLADGLSALNP